MGSNNLKKSTLDGLIWKLLENFGSQFINFVIQIVLARLLMPEDYGVIALTGVFIIIANVFVQTGFSSALIQKKDVSDLEYSSVYYAGIFVSVVLYLVLYIISPLIASFYKEPLLKWVLRVQSLTIIFSGISSVQNSILVRNLQFKRSFKYKLLGTILQGVTGITLAVLGYGVWSLVIGSIVNSAVITVSLLIVVSWKPKLFFSFSKLGNLFSFSSRILVLNLFNTIYNSITSLIIGKSFNSMTLGYYNRGMQIPHLVMVNTDGAINAVMFPVLSKYQEEPVKLVSALRRSLKISCFIVFPLMIGLAIISKPLTILLLTEKWLPSVPFMIITSITCITWPFSVNFQAYNAIGRSDVSLKLNITVKIISVSMFAISIRYGVYALVISFLIVSIISVIIGFYVTERVIGYKIGEQIKDVLPSLLISLIMGAIVYTLNVLRISMWQTLILQVSIGIILYIALAKLFKIESFDYLIVTIMGIVKKRNRV